jgi:hypothetical protein
VLNASTASRGGLTTSAWPPRFRNQCAASRLSASAKSTPMAFATIGVAPPKFAAAITTASDSAVITVSSTVLRTR